MAHNLPRLKPFRLPDLTYPLVIDTVGKMLAMGNEISASCNTHGCRQHFRVNLVAIARHAGMDYPCLAGDLLKIVHCRRCRAAGRPDRDLTLTQHIAGRHSDWPRSSRACSTRNACDGSASKAWNTE